jgi:holo-[acyl-carrier protein] synthase
MAMVGLGIDLVSVPDFAEQADQPCTVFAEILLPG